MKYKTLITAHSGAENTRDNTMDSIRVMAGCGADIIEVDVRLFEGTLVMSHDVPACAENCEPLEDCFCEISGYPGVRINIDLKTCGLLPLVAELARKHGAEDRLLFTGGVDAGDLAYAQENGLTVWYNNDGLPEGEDWIEGIDRLNCEVLNLEHCDVDEKLLEHAGRLSVWTVDDEAMLRRFIEAGVRSITTRRPVLAARIRAQLNGEEAQMKVVTFNIRGDFGIDGGNNFRFRKPLILEKLRREQPDVVGFQELMPHAAAWLRENLTDYYLVGCGREAQLDGECTGVAYRKDIYNLIEMRTFWLSETPCIPATRYAVQSDCPRTATELVLMEYATGRVFRVINTHLDHEGTPARRLGLEQILRHLEEVRLFPDAPVILMGDFNAPPDSEEMRVLDEYPGYVNATRDVGITYHGYMKAEYPEYIDYIILRGRVRCLGIEKWTDEKDGVYLSDHYPICARIALDS